MVLSAQTRSVFVGSLLALVVLVALLGKARALIRGPKALLAWLNAATDGYLCACDGARPGSSLRHRRPRRPSGVASRGPAPRHAKGAKPRASHPRPRKAGRAAHSALAPRCGHGSARGVPASAAWRNAGHAGHADAHAAHVARAAPVINHVGCTSPR